MPPRPTGKRNTLRFFLKTPQIYYAALTPDDQSVVFSAVAGVNKYYKYELFTINMKTHEAKQ